MKDAKKTTKKKARIGKNILATHVKSHTGSSRARYVVVTAQTLVDEIIVSYCCRKDNESASAYIKPIVDHFNGEIERGVTKISEDWRVSSFMVRRATSPGNNTPLKTGKELSYDWESIVTINPSEDVSPEDVSNTIALQFSQFENESFKRQKFESRVIKDMDRKPVNFFLLDDDVVTLLRIVYSDSGKDELMGDDEVLISFFGSIEYGQRVLSSYSKIKWDFVLEGVV